MIIHFFQYLAIFEQNLIILPQDISLTPCGLECKHSSFSSICHKISKYFNLQITLWGKHGLLVNEKNYYLLVTISQILVKNLLFLPQNDPIKHTNRVWDIKNNTL
jgi:hypothetical protein